MRCHPLLDFTAQITIGSAWHLASPPARRGPTRSHSAALSLPIAGWTRWPTAATATNARVLGRPRGLESVSSTQRRSNRKEFQHHDERRKPDEAPDAGSAPGWPDEVSGQAHLQARISFALIAAIVIVDLAIPWAGWSYMPRWQGLSFVPRAIVDEPCAVATALIVLGAITRFRGAPPYPKFGWSLLAWSVLIDVDHLPEEFGTSVLTEATPRPHLHALWVPVLLTLARLADATGPGTPRLPQLGLRRRYSRHGLRNSRTLSQGCGDRSDVTVVAGHQGRRTRTLLGIRVELLVIVAMPPVRRRVSIVQSKTSEPAVAPGMPPTSITRSERSASADTTTG